MVDDQTRGISVGRGGGCLPREVGRKFMGFVYKNWTKKIRRALPGTVKESIYEILL